MSFKAVFELDGKKFDVIRSSYSFHQETDGTGRPNSGVRGGSISLEVLSVADSTITEWAADPYKHYDGKIIFFSQQTEKKMKEVIFKEGYVVSYSEIFSSTGTTPMTEHFIISAKEIKAGNAEHKNDWPS